MSFISLYHLSSYWLWIFILITKIRHKSSEICPEPWFKPQTTLSRILISTTLATESNDCQCWYSMLKCKKKPIIFRWSNKQRRWLHNTWCWFKKWRHTSMWGLFLSSTNKYTWSKEDEDLENDGNSLILTNITESDFGIYSCTVEQEINTRTFIIELIPYGE